MSCSPIAKSERCELNKARDAAIAAETRLHELRQERMRLQQERGLFGSEQIDSEYVPVDTVQTQEE